MPFSHLPIEYIIRGEKGLKRERPEEKKGAVSPDGSVTSEIPAQLYQGPVFCVSTLAGTGLDFPGAPHSHQDKSSTREAPSSAAHVLAVPELSVCLCTGTMGVSGSRSQGNVGHSAIPNLRRCQTWKG